MKKIMLSAVILMISSLVLVNQISAQFFDKQKAVKNNQAIKVESNKSVAPNIAAPNVVKSLNDLTGDVTLQAGANITVTPNGNSLIVAAPNALAAIVTDGSLTGNGTQGNPLRVAAVPDSAMRFSESVAFSISPNISAGGATLMTVPAGKRLVIEHVSGQCFVPPGQFILNSRLESTVLCQNERSCLSFPRQSAATRRSAIFMSRHLRLSSMLTLYSASPRLARDGRVRRGRLLIQLFGLANRPALAINIESHAKLSMN